ncbi:DAK2 domain-containing protein [Bavariicoccus seileri]|nr:DAK2 domain-containing protein [Bavariicoccus seileri]
MVKNKLTVEDLENMIQLGNERLTDNAELVNSLNVFPVPDGDTGTNMNLSFTSGSDRVISNGATTVGDMANDLAKGLLMGARGNSGVILSQLFRGFSQSLAGKDTVDAIGLAAAFQKGVETAYQAVMKPVEGTILTVARESAAEAEKAANETGDCVAVVKSLVKGAQISLDHTPELLSVLKEVGVVDSGGQGLTFIYEGFYEALTGQRPTRAVASTKVDLTSVAHHEFVDVAHASTGDIKYGYCTEIMVQIGEGETVCDTFDYDIFRNYLNELGDSLLVVADDEIIKVHVHTERPGNVMNYGQRFGSLVKVKVDNMRLQNNDFIKKDSTKEILEKSIEPQKEYAIIAIASGEGVGELFKSVGVTNLISGGQTMNPSTEDICKEIEKTNAKNVIILPNNKNIFMAANQAAEVLGDYVKVVLTKSIPLGLAAMLGFNPQATLAENVASMTETISYVKSGQITTAIRDTVIDSVEIHKNDFMSIVDGAIIASVPEEKEALTTALLAMLDEESEIVTIIVGEQGSTEIANEVAEKLLAEDDNLEVEVHTGNQPVYQYLFSVE